MNWPTSQDYNEAVQDPTTSFSDPDLKGGQVALNAMGLPIPRSGNFADVYEFTGADGKKWALKCFTRKVPGLKERYARIDEHLTKARLPFTVGFKFLMQGARIRGEWYPLLKMEWVEGFTLNDFVANNLDKPQYLHALVQMWAKLAGRVRDANMAHADLQHGNVLLVPGATPQKLGLRLIDYDGMWVPALADSHSGEVGHPNFQHPLRLKDRSYNGDVDRFPHLVIAAGLRAALVGGKAVWDQFDNGDNLLFKEADLRDPANAPIFKALWKLNDPVLRTFVGHIALSVGQPLKKTPWLDQVLFADGGPKLTADEERRVCDLLGVTAAAPAGVKAAPAAIQQEYNVFDFQAEDEPMAFTESARRPVTRRKPAKKSNLPLFVGGGVAAAVLVAGAIAAVVLGGKKDPPTEVAVVKPKEEGPKHVEPEPEGPNKVEPKPPAVGTDVVATKDDLRAALADTRWAWLPDNPKEILTLKGDGSIAHDNWGNAGFAIRWEAIDRRTVLMTVGSGRAWNRYSLLEFSEDLKEFNGFNFEETGRMGEKPRVGALGRPDFRPSPGMPTRSAKAGLETQLTGTEWPWLGGRLGLKADGVAELPGRAKGFARWEAVDRRTAVVLIVDPARDRDRMAVLQFSDDLQEMTGYGFERAAKLRPAKRLGESGPVTPVVGEPKTPPIGVAALPAGRDYLFIRENDPNIYRTVNASARMAEVVGKNDGPVHVLAVSPDGLRVLAAGENGEVKLWPLGSGKEPPPSVPLVGHEGTVRAAAISPDGKRAVTVAADNKLCEWELDTGKRLKRVDLPNVRAVAFLKDAQMLLIGTEDKSAQLWSLDRQVPVRALAGHTGPVTAVCVSPTGDLMFTAGADGIVRTWDAAGRAVGSLPPAGSEITALAVSPDGRLLATGGPAGVLRFFVAKTGRSGGSHSGKAGPRALAFLAGGTEIIAGRAPDPVLIKIDGLAAIPPDSPATPAATPVVLKLEQEADLKGGLPQRMGYRPDGKYLWVQRDKELVVLDGRTGQPIKAWPVEFVMSADFGPAKELCLVNGFRLQLWDVETGVMLREHLAGDLRQFLACLPTHEPNKKLVTSPNNEVVVWDVAGWKEVERFTPFADGRIIAAGAYPGNRRYVFTVAPPNDKFRYAVYDVANRREAFVLEEPAGMPRVLRFEVSPDARWILGFAAEGGANGQILVWNGQTGKHERTVNGVAAGRATGGFSPAGDHFVFCAPPSRRTDLHIPTGKLTEAETDVKPALVADGAPAAGLLATADIDGKVRVYRFEGSPTPPPPPPPPAVVATPADGSGLTLVREINLGSPAQAVGYRADGKYLWVLRADRIAVIDAQTGAEVKAWPAPPGSYPADFGPNKELLVVANGKLQTWDWEMGTMVREYSLRDEPQGTSIIQVLPTHLPSRRLLTTTGPSLIVYDVIRGQELDRLTPYPGERMHVAAAFPGNRRIVGDSHSLRGKSRFVVWDQTTKKEVLALAEVPDLKHLFRVEVSPDGKWVLALARDAQGGQIATWDARTGKLVRVVTVPTKTDGYSGGFTPAGDTYLFVEPGGRRTALHVPTGKLTEAGAEVKAANWVDAVPALGLFASADADAKLRLYRFADAPKTGTKVETKVEGKVESKTPKTDTPVVAVGAAKHSAELPDTVAGCIVSPDGKRVFAGTRKGTVHLLDVATGVESGKGADVGKAGIAHMAMGAKSARFYVLDNERQLHAFEGLTKFKATDLGKEAGLSPVTATARMLVSPGDVYLMIFEPDSSRLTTGFSRMMSKWAVPAIPPVLDRTNFSRYTNAIGYSADGSVGAATANGFDQELLVWQMAPFRDYPVIPTTGDVRWLGVSSEAKVVVVAGSSRLEAWRYEKGSAVIPRTAPHDSTSFVGAVSGVGLVTAGEDKTLKLWDLRTGKEAGQWSLPEPPAGVAVTPDGKTAVVWYTGGRKVGLWPLPDLKAKKP